MDGTLKASRYEQTNTSDEDSSASEEDSNSSELTDDEPNADDFNSESESDSEFDIGSEERVFVSVIFYSVSLIFCFTCRSIYVVDVLLCLRWC